MAGRKLARRHYRYLEKTVYPPWARLTFTDTFTGILLLLIENMNQILVIFHALI